MGYVFTIITENDPEERYNVLGTGLGSYYEGEGKLAVSVLDESGNKIAIFRNVKAVNSFDESMLTQNEIRKMIGPQLPLVIKPIKDEGIVKDAQVQQPKKEETKKRVRNVDHGKIVALSKAGWKIKQICEEMHVSEVMVYNHLKMEKEHEKEQGM